MMMVRRDDLAHSTIGIEIYIEVLAITTTLYIFVLIFDLIKMYQNTLWNEKFS